MNTTPIDLLRNELSMVEWELNSMANPIDWREALAIGELNFPEAQELLAKFYDLQAQINRLSQGGSSD